TSTTTSRRPPAHSNNCHRPNRTAPAHRQSWVPNARVHRWKRSKADGLWSNPNNKLFHRWTNQNKPDPPLTLYDKPGRKSRAVPARVSCAKCLAWQGPAKRERERNECGKSIANEVER